MSAGLLSGITAERVRGSADGMRAGLRELAARGRDVWTGDLTALVEVLAEVARVDLALARLTEGHADGLRILAQAGREPREGVYGVWASRSAGTGVKAARDPEASGADGWHLDGELRFASGIDLIDRALLPGWLDHDHHQLFDIPADAVRPDYTSWPTTAMDASRSFTGVVEQRCSVEDQVGEINFYLERPGFVVGGLAVAAVWAGGAQQLVDLVANGTRAFTPGAHQLRRLGAMEQAAWLARTAVASAARRLPDLTRDEVAREISHARVAVVDCCERVDDEAAKVVGPGGLSRNVRLVRARDDLAIYIRQLHADGELERLGVQALDEPEVRG
jgi:hypothetical protein